MPTKTTLALEPRYKSTHDKLYALLSKSLPFNQVVKVDENFAPGSYAFVTEKVKYAALPENERPKYVVFFNEPIAAGTNGQISFATTVLKYQANQWEKPVKSKYSSTYVIKAIKLTKPGAAINANLELSFNNALNGQTFLPLIENVTYYMPLKRQPGMTLHDLISVLKEDPAYLTPLQYYALAKSLIEDLVRIHERNLIHCDIKPANILVDIDTLSMRLVDFGFMRKFDEDTSFRGTPKYADKACLTGNMPQDKISDIYAAVLCIHELFGEYEHDENIHIHRICANIMSITRQEMRIIQGTLRCYSQPVRENRQTNLAELDIIFTNLMHACLQDDQVSVDEKINSTMTVKTIEMIGFDKVMLQIKSLIGRLNISVIEILIQHGLKLNETNALTDALIQPNVTLFKIRRLHELGAPFTQDDFLYWLNERPIEANHLQSWAEISLYLYEALDNPEINASVTANDCEEKRIFITHFLNPQTPWQDSTIAKKIKQQMALKQEREKLIYFRGAHFASLINKDIEQNPNINAVQTALALCRSYTTLLIECQNLIKIDPMSPIVPSIKKLEADISKALDDTTIMSIGQYVIKLNQFTKNLNQYSKTLRLLTKVAMITTTPFDTLKIPDINYCVMLHDANTNLIWFLNRTPTLPQAYLFAIQSLIIEATDNFKPGKADLIGLTALEQLAAFKKMIEAFEKLDDNTGIKNLVISELPLLLSNVTEQNIENLTLIYQSLLENLIKPVKLKPGNHLEHDYNRYKVDMFSDITYIYPDNIGLIQKRLTRYHSLSQAILKFLEKIEFSYQILENTPGFEQLQAVVDDSIKILLIDEQTTVTSLNNLLTKTRFLEQIVIESDEYMHEWHQQIRACSAHHNLTTEAHNNALTLSDYHKIQRNVTAYLSTNSPPNHRILECVITYIQNNDIDSANRLLIAHKKRAPQSLFFVKEEPELKRRRAMLPFDF